MVSNLQRIVNMYDKTPYACVKYLFYFALIVKVSGMINPYIESTVSLLRFIEITFMIGMSLIFIRQSAEDPDCKVGYECFCFVRRVGGRNHV